MARGLLWESLKPSWKGTVAELAAHVRNMTGGLDSRALGVGPSQRAGESMWLGFSPRLLRSTVALVDELRRGPMDPVGREAWRSLGGLAAGATGLYVLAGVAMGRPREEIVRGLNPLEGKRFLSYDINGNWIGVGGQVRALTQLMAQVTVGTALDVRGGRRPGIAKLDQFDNPLIAYYEGRGAVGYNIAAAGIEATTGANALPYENVDGTPDLINHLGTSALPFSIQNFLEGQSPLAIGAGFLGARTSRETITERRSALAQREYGVPYDELTRQQALDFRKAHPSYFTQPGALPAGSPMRRQIELTQQRAEQIGALGQAVKNGSVKPEEYGNLRGDILREIAIRRDEAGSDFAGKSTTAEDKALDVYYKTIQTAEKQSPLGRFESTGDWAQAEAQARDAVQQQYGPQGLAALDSALTASADPVEKQYLSDVKAVAASGYFDIDEHGFQSDVWRKRFADAGMWAAKDYRSLVDFEEAYVARRAADPNNVLAVDAARRDFERLAVVRAYQRAVTQTRQTWFANAPDLLRKSAYWGLNTLSKRERQILEGAAGN